MKILIGLGNPGVKYHLNRHNAGFMFVDFLIKELTDSRIDEFKENKQTNSLMAKLLISNIEIILAKPQTFMNLSGTAVRPLIKNLKLKIENLIIVHDDLDIPLGKFKIQKGVGPKLHNGIESIEKIIGTKDFLRVRIGVDNRLPDNRINGESYVLQDFTTIEYKTIMETFPVIYERLKSEFF